MSREGDTTKDFAEGRRKRTVLGLWLTILGSVLTLIAALRFAEPSVTLLIVGVLVISLGGYWIDAGVVKGWASTFKDVIPRR